MDRIIDRGRAGAGGGCAYRRQKRVEETGRTASGSEVFSRARVKPDPRPAWKERNGWTNSSEGRSESDDQRTFLEFVANELAVRMLHSLT